MFLTTKTWKREYNALVKIYLNWRDKTNEQITELQKKCEQLEKRINILSDYIQGPYTKQINQNFAEIQMQLKMTEPTKKLQKYYKQFDTKKVKKCQNGKN